MDASKEQLLTAMLACQDLAVNEVQEAVERLHSVAKKATVPGLMPVESLLDPVPTAIRRAPEELLPIATTAVRVDLELSDFLSWPVHHYTSPSALATLAISTIGGGMIGFHRVGSGLLHIGNVLGLRSVRSILLASAGLFGITTLALVASDLQRTVSRNLTRKIKRQLRATPQLTRELNTTVYHARRQLESASFQLKKCAATALERTQVMHGEQARRLAESTRARDYFRGVGVKAEGLAGMLERSTVKRRVGVLEAATLQRPAK
jgi:hypothetical protein